MGLIKSLGRNAWRKYVVDGVLASGVNRPDTIDIFPFVDTIDAYVTALNGGGEMQGEWDASAGTFPGAGAATTGQSWIVSTAGTVDGIAFRIGDRVIAITDTASTATYAGNWIRLAAALEPVVHGADSGASTANAIAITTDYAVSADGGQLIAFVVPVTNTSGAVTVAFNGGTALAVKTAAGNNPAVGGLAAGMPLFGQITNSGAWFRLLSDQASAAIQAAAEAAQVAAEAAAASISFVTVASRTALKAVNTAAYQEALFDGDQWHFVAGDYSAEVAADTQEGVYIKADDTASASGAWVRQLFLGLVSPEMFQAAGDETAADDGAFSGIRSYAEAVGGAAVILKPGSIYRTTATIDWTDLTAPIRIHGPGSRLAAFFGDFTGPGDAIIDISFTDDANRINGIMLEDFAIWSNGVVGDPIGIMAKASQQQTINRIHIPGTGTTVLGAERKLFNSGIVMTKVNNSEVNETTLQCGYQPVAFDVGATVRFSVSGTTCTADEDVFTSAMAGEYIIFDTGADSDDSTDYFVTTIASFTDAGEVELTDTPPGTISSARASIGHVTGSVTASDATLTLDQEVLTSAHAGMIVCIPKGSQRSDAGNNAGLLVTTIASYTSATECELADTPDNSSGTVPIIFAPAMFVGQFADEDADNRQTNDLVLRQVQIEGFEAVGLVVARAIALYITNCKIHAESWSNSPNSVTRSMFAAVISECLSVEIRGTPFSYGWHPVYGQVWVMASRGHLIVEGIEILGLVKNQPIVYLDDTITATFRVDFGPVWSTDGLTKHDATWQPVRTPAAFPKSVEYHGPVFERKGEREYGRQGTQPEYVSGRWYTSPLITGSSGASNQAGDTIYVYPIHVPHRVSIDGLGCRSNGAVASTNVKLALYSNRDGRPDLLVAGTDAIDVSTTGQKSDAITAVTLEPGIYWFAAMVDGAPQLRAVPTTAYNLTQMMGGGSIDQAIGASPLVALSKSQTYSGGLPATLNGASWSAVTTAVAPLVVFEVA